MSFRRSFVVPVLAGFLLGVAVTLAVPRFSGKGTSPSPADLATPSSDTALTAAQAEVAQLKSQLKFSEDHVRQLQASAP